MAADLTPAQENQVRQDQRAYKLCFGSPAGAEVLIDLADFCRANESCVIPGDRDRTTLLEGRREVWLRIQQRLNLTVSQLASLYVRQPIYPTEDPDNG